MADPCTKVMNRGIAAQLSGLSLVALIYQLWTGQIVLDFSLYKTANLYTVNISTGSQPPEGLTGQLIESFKDLLSRGVLQWGTKLPPERELAQKFGVSRVSLRHALKALELFGIITQRVGDGTYLSSNPSKVLEPALDFLLLVEDISPIDVADTRLMVEPELAASAARNARAENVDEIASILDNMRGEREEGKQIALDLAFHHSIFTASGNRLATTIFSILHRSMQNCIGLTSKLVQWEHTMAFHEPIYIAIRERNEEAAREAMRSHLRDSRQLLLLSTTTKRSESDVTAIPKIGKRRL